MKFYVHDKVQLLDEEGDGVISKLIGSNRALVSMDGFDYEFELSHLIKVGPDNTVTHNAASRSFDYLIKSKVEINASPLTVHLSKEVLDQVNNKGVPEIDLHIHKLVLSHKALSNYEMINIQTQRLEEFIHTCMDNYINKFVVIHGVGEGVLRTEIRKVLSAHGNIKFEDADFRIYGAGATQARILGLHAS